MSADLPETMNAIEITEPGGPEVLQSCERSVPAPERNEVLIRVAAAGVNRPDVMQRKGIYPPPEGASDLPGLEVAGEVVALGEGVNAGSVKLQEKVCALVAGGGYAEYCTAPAPQCLPVPDGFSMEEAAAVPETFFTVWTNVFERGALTKGESILIHGGSSGIGTTAIMLAKAFGATVYATAGSAEKCTACEDLGADAAINYKDEDFAQRIEDLTGGTGVDVVLDMVGADYYKRNIASLATGGRLVFIATLTGIKAELNILPIMLKRLTVTGSTLRPRSVAEKGGIAEALREKVWPLLDAGTIRPVLHQTFPLDQASAAHALMDSSAHIGKIVLKTGA